MRKMTVKTARKVRDILGTIGVVIALVGIVWEPFLYIGIAVTFSGIIPDLRYNRCPHCGRHLRRNEGDYCQYCGKWLPGQDRGGDRR